MIEKMISGREFSVGILRGNALPVIEIISKEGFYDYKNKYQSGSTTEICPADLSEYDTKRVQDAALRVHDILRLGM
jgi:D-alanine-D-alanine ligase